MLPAVDRLLGREAFDLFGEFWGSFMTKRADTLDEIGLALGKGGRERIIDGGRLDASAVP